MDLWIRSQNRKQITKFESLICEQNGDRFAVEVLTTGYSFLVGTYKTEERALEVLDEIERLITDLQYMSYAIPNNDFSGYRPNVYQMPKE